MWDDDPEPSAFERELMRWLRLEEDWMKPLAVALIWGLLLFFILPR